MKPYLLEREDLRPRPIFLDWARDVHSQCGEDGILEHLLSILDIPDRYFVEFGAWDGRHLSNCAALADRGYSGCFIEGDPSRHADLVRGYAARQDIACVNAYVRSHGPESLDAILDGAGAPSEIAVLSIDIDGTDYHVWAGFRSRTPAIVVVEYNPTIPPEVLFAQADDASIHHGCSLAALHALGRDKGYVLAAATELNGIFVRSDLCEKVQLTSYLPYEVKPLTYQTALFHGFDGHMIVAGHRTLLWHGVHFDAEDLQILPAELRRFPIGQSADYFAKLTPFIERSSSKT
ncbi:hypothetical protein [Bosea sp. (in: a-proteobacteria)]|uniref:hypothetical protein n=1 Tax=Bosea sp. (in: a-proteobacteria) TaxID=1871050 RepID=UPI003F6FF666